MKRYFKFLELEIGKLYLLKPSKKSFPLVFRRNINDINIKGVNLDNKIILCLEQRKIQENQPIITFNNRSLKILVEDKIWWFNFHKNWIYYDYFRFVNIK